MRLIQLSSNQQSFHTVNFKNGLNLIVGKKNNPDDDNLKNTYNGVGKSLLIELIHYCLASDEVLIFKDKLSGWEFNLKFEIEGEEHLVTRRCNDQSNVLYDGNQISIKAFRKLLENEVFFIAEPRKYLTFRSLLSRFIRRGKDNYHSFDTFVSQETPYQKLVNTGYLLGLDMDLIQKKYELKERLDKIGKIKGSLANDEILKRFFNNNKKEKEINIEIKDLQDKIEKLSASLSAFSVAEDYYNIQELANSFKRNLQNCENEILLLSNDLDSINKSLSVKSDLTIDTVALLYKEANFIMPEKIVKKIEEVQVFHDKLTTSRIRRLVGEREKINTEINAKLTLKEKLTIKLDENRKYLGEHGALDDFVSLSEKCSEMKTNLNKLTDYKEMLREYKNQIEVLKIELSKENILTSEYLKLSKNIIDKNINLFREFSKEFYENKPGGIDILNNENNNQTRFDIKVKIEDDTSDGINEVKIFCFDFTLLLASFRHRLGFIIHDSRLYSNMDPRQRSTLFKMAHEYSNKFNRQYIATINEDNLDRLIDYYGEEKYKEIIINNNILELTDESAKSKLLGIQIDLEY